MILLTAWTLDSCECSRNNNNQEATQEPAQAAEQSAPTEPAEKAITPVKKVVQLLGKGITNYNGYDLSDNNWAKVQEVLNDNEFYTNEKFVYEHHIMGEDFYFGFGIFLLDKGEGKSLVLHQITGGFDDKVASTSVDFYDFDGEKLTKLNITQSSPELANIMALLKKNMNNTTEAEFNEKLMFDNQILFYWDDENHKIKVEPVWTYDEEFAHDERFISYPTYWVAYFLGDQFLKPQMDGTGSSFDGYLPENLTELLKEAEVQDDDYNIGLVAPLQIKKEYLTYSLSVRDQVGGVSGLYNIIHCFKRNDGSYLVLYSQKYQFDTPAWLSENDEVKINVDKVVSWYNFKFDSTDDNHDFDKLSQSPLAKFTDYHKAEKNPKTYLDYEFFNDGKYMKASIPAETPTEWCFYWNGKDFEKVNSIPAPSANIPNNAPAA